MKTEIDLTDVSYSYLKKLASKYQVNESEIVEGLLIGFALRKLGKKSKILKKKKLFSFSGETFNLLPKDKS